MKERVCAIRERADLPENHAPSREKCQIGLVLTLENCHQMSKAFNLYSSLATMRPNSHRLEFRFAPVVQCANPLLSTPTFLDPDPSILFFPRLNFSIEASACQHTQRARADRRDEVGFCEGVDDRRSGRQSSYEPRPGILEGGKKS